MYSLKVRLFLQTLLLCVSLAVLADAQTTNDDDTEKIFTEEIKLNVLALDRSGKFISDVRKEDLVIMEDGILHQAGSIRRLPANVLIVLDTGGEMRQVKSFNQTRNTAKNLVSELREEDSVAILQYSDKAEIVAEWTTDKNEILNAINKKTNFGKRSAFVEALNLATDFLEKNPLENKHLILITDGTDSLDGQTEKAAAMKRLLATDINVHVISYTKLELDDIEPRTKAISKTPARKTLPDEVIAGLPNGVRDVARTPPAVTINTDRKFLKVMRERKAALEESQKALSDLAANTNGEFILPDTTEEMLEKTGLVASVIDSSYVVTYVPKRPLGEVKTTEERDIEVFSRRTGLQVQAKRKLIVNPETNK